MSKKSSKAEHKDLKRLISDVVLGTARTPVVLRDPGFGETITEYEVLPGIFMRIAKQIQMVEDEPVVEYFCYAQEPPLVALEEAIYARTVERIFELLDPELVLEGFDPASFFRENIIAVCKDLRLDPTPGRVAKLQYYLSREILGHSILEPWMRDTNIEDIKVIRPGFPALVIHRNYSALGWLMTNAVFHNPRHLDELIMRFARAGRRPINPAQPIADFTTEAGVRMAAALGKEVTRYGSALSIRKFPETTISITRLIQQGVVSPLLAAYLWFIAERKALFFIAGPTGSGKTTVLNAILGLVSPLETLHTIEEVFEISPHTPRYIGFTVKRGTEASGVEVGIPDILKLNLRMRPDYLVVGEIRVARDLNTFLDVAGTGHSGLATIHANNPDYLLMRLKAMGIDPAAAEKLWGCAITLPALRRGDSLLRRVTTLADFVPQGAGEIAPVNVVTWLPESDSFIPDTAEELFERSPRLRDYVSYTRVSKESVISDLQKKQDVLSGLVKDGVFDFHTVARRIATLPIVERFIE